MKKQVFLLVVIILTMGNSLAGTYSCGLQADAVTCTGATEYACRYVSVASDCSSSRTTYYCTTSPFKACDFFTECTSCGTGYTLTRLSTTPSSGYCANVSYETCCKNCSNCTSDTKWSAYNTGYVRKAKRTCNCDGTCTTTYQYACASGYFGYTTNGTSGCNKCSYGMDCPEGNNGVGFTCISGFYMNSNMQCARCPSITDLYLDPALSDGSQPYAGSTSDTISDCYIPAGNYYDAGGAVQITTDQACKYEM